MSENFSENGHARGLEDAAVDQLPADLVAIYERLTRDSASWARQLPAAEPLQGYLRELGTDVATMDAAARPADAAIRRDEFDLVGAQPKGPAPAGRPGATYAHPSRRAVWGGAFSAVAVVALLAVLFAIVSHPHGSTKFTSTTATAGLTPTTATTCAPDQITLTLPNHAQLYQIDMTSPTDGWALAGMDPPGSTANPAPHSVLLHFHQCHWTPVPDPLAGADVFLQNISMATAEDGWAAGTESNGSGMNVRCVLLHYTGGQWQRVALPPQIQGRSSCYRVRMSSPQEGWLLGQWGASSGVFPDMPQRLLHYDNGVWTQVESPISDLFDLAPTGPDDLWVAGVRVPASDPNHVARVNMAHYSHGQWMTFQLDVYAEAWLHMNSPSDGWLIPNTLPIEVLHYDGIAWRLSPFSAHTPASGIVTVFDSGDAWTIAMNQKDPPQVTGMQHYVDGQWQTVQWPFPDIFLSSELTRTAPGEYWAIGAHELGGTYSRTVLLYYTGGAWHEYGA